MIVLLCHDGGHMTLPSKHVIGCKNRGCCYGPGGGVAKCSECNNAYKKFLEDKNTSH